MPLLFAVHFVNALDWTGVASAVAAVGTLVLAGITVSLARQTKRAALATADEAAASRAELAAGQRPIVAPPPGAGPYHDEAGTLCVPVTNVGPGAALVVVGRIGLAGPDDQAMDIQPGEMRPLDAQIEVLGPTGTPGPPAVLEAVRQNANPREPVPSFKLIISYRDVAGTAFVTSLRWAASARRYSFAVAGGEGAAAIAEAFESD